VIAGTVFRENGFSLAGAAVTLSPKDAAKVKKMQSVSDSRGEFAFRVPARPGAYIIKASLKGFQSAEKEVSLAGEERVEVTLALSSESKRQGVEFMSPKRSIERVLAVAAVALIVSASLSAQKKTKEERREEANSRSVMGLVVGMDDQPASGAVVQLKDMRTLQVRSFITQTDGQYRFSGLRADTDYQLTAKAGDASAAPRTLSLFDNRKEAVMNFKLDKK